MATTPTPVATRPRSTPLPPRHGSMTFQLQRLSQPLELEQVCRDPSWDRFKTIMVVMGGLAIMAWLVYGSFQVGASTAQRPSYAIRQTAQTATVSRRPVVVVRQAPSAVSTPAVPNNGGELTAAERERRFKEYLRQQDR